MSEHHHHNNHGQQDNDNPSPRSWKPARHNWFFYVAGLFILVALFLFTFFGNLAWRPTLPPPSDATGGK